MTQTLYRSVAVFSVLALLAAAAPALAKVEVVSGNWMLNAPSEITFSCGGGSYVHTLDTVSQDENGDFTGTGHYNPNAGYTWNITGNVSGDDITFTIVYTGISAGSTYNSIGTIAPDGSISGTVDSNCQTFSMPEGTATKVTAENHGQYVSSQENKQEAAQSRIGMPVQSKGHTK